ncbi:17019_t:CDS:2, partial [Dentiscutata heterogama]
MAEIQDAAESIENINSFNSLKINHGLTISAEGAILRFSTKQRDSFLFENHIDHAINLIYCDWISANFTENPLTKMIKPSKEMVAKTKEALKHYNPYNELMNVFEIYGKFLPKRVILGHKIYRVTRLIADESLPDFNFKEWKWTAFDFMAKEYNDILSQWEWCMVFYGFNSSYFVSIDDKLIMKDDLEKWMKSCSESDYDSLQIISWNELYPIYEIFEEPLCQEIKSILGIIYQPERFNVKEKVLFSGIIPFNASIFSYRVNFPTRFKSKDYQIFGKLVKQNGKPIDKVFIKFKSMDIYGFYAFVEGFNAIEEDTELQIEWILIGIPAKIGFFSMNTRNIRILRSISTSFSVNTFETNWNIILDIQESLPRNSIFVTSFKYSSNCEPNFEADIRNYRYNDNKIELGVYYASDKNSMSSPIEIDDSSPMALDDSLPMEIEDSYKNIFTKSDVNGDESRCLVHCFILSLESQKKLIVHLNAIGKTVNSEMPTGQITPPHSIS